MPQITFTFKELKPILERNAPALAEGLVTFTFKELKRDWAVIELHV